MASGGGVGVVVELEDLCAQDATVIVAIRMSSSSSGKGAGN